MSYLAPQRQSNRPSPQTNFSLKQPKRNSSLKQPKRNSSLKQSKTNSSLKQQSKGNSSLKQQSKGNYSSNQPKRVYSVRKSTNIVVPSTDNRRPTDNSSSSLNQPDKETMLVKHSANLELPEVTHEQRVQRLVVQHITKPAYIFFKQFDKDGGTYFVNLVRNAINNWKVNCGCDKQIRDICTEIKNIPGILLNSELKQKLIDGIWDTHSLQMAYCEDRNGELCIRFSDFLNIRITYAASFGSQCMSTTSTHPPKGASFHPKYREFLPKDKVWWIVLHWILMGAAVDKDCK
jgi:hypothetical protein